jgi:hypothetical protein
MQLLPLFAFPNAKTLPKLFKYRRPDNFLKPIYNPAPILLLILVLIPLHVLQSLLDTVAIRHIDID